MEGLASNPAVSEGDGIMKRRAWLAVTILPVLLSAYDQVLAFTPDSGWVKTEENPPIDLFLPNRCNNGEVIHIVGDARISIKTRTLTDGTVQVKEDDHLSGDGLGTSGSEYKYNEMAHINASTGPMAAPAVSIAL